MPTRGIARLLASVPGILAASAIAAEGPEDSLVGELEMLRFSNQLNRVAVDVAPEDHRDFLLWLDTGAMDSVLTPAAARANGVSVRRTKSSPYIRKTSLGKDLQFWVDTSRSDHSSSAGWDYGLLGGRYLSKFVVELDFDAGVVRFYDAKRFEVPATVSGEDEVVLPMRVTANRPFIQVDLGGKKPLQVLLDTGAPMSLLVSDKALKKIGIRYKSLPKGSRLSFTRGDSQMLFKERQRLRIGPFDLGEVPMEVAPRGSYNLGGNTDSLIGYDLISQFKLRLDYQRGRIWLKRRAGVPVTFFGTDIAIGQQTGAYMGSAPSQVFVQFVRSGSPAWIYGLRAGDYFDQQALFPQLLHARTVATAIREGRELYGSRRVGRDEIIEVAYPGGENAIPAAGAYTDEDD